MSIEFLAEKESNCIATTRKPATLTHEKVRENNDILIPPNLNIRALITVMSIETIKSWERNIEVTTFESIPNKFVGENNSPNVITKRISAINVEMMKIKISAILFNNFICWT